MLALPRLLRVPQLGVAEGLALGQAPLNRWLKGTRFGPVQYLHSPSPFVFPSVLVLSQEKMAKDIQQRVEGFLIPSAPRESRPRPLNGVPVGALQMQLVMLIQIAVGMS